MGINKLDVVNYRLNKKKIKNLEDSNRKLLLESIEEYIGDKDCVTTDYYGIYIVVTTGRIKYSLPTYIDDMAELKTDSCDLEIPNTVEEMQERIDMKNRALKNARQAYLMFRYIDG